jgi:hypothetical protein
MCLRGVVSPDNVRPPHPSLILPRSTSGCATREARLYVTPGTNCVERGEGKRESHGNRVLGCHHTRVCSVHAHPISPCRCGLFWMQQRCCPSLYVRTSSSPRRGSWTATQRWTHCCAGSSSGSCSSLPLVRSRVVVSWTAAGVFGVICDVVSVAVCCACLLFTHIVGAGRGLTYAGCSGRQCGIHHIFQGKGIRSNGRSEVCVPSLLCCSGHHPCGEGPRGPPALRPATGRPVGMDRHGRGEDWSASHSPAAVRRLRGAGPQLAQEHCTLRRHPDDAGDGAAGVREK